MYKELEEMLEAGYVVKQSHPEADLHICNYTPMAQYQGMWNEVTLQCRGLILDGKGTIIARPFRKFFNLGERPDISIPQESFEVFEKMDGPLGISYFLNGKPLIASRGSFSSIQAEKANAMLMGKYKAAAARMKQDRTYLFEIIYPENRIVVNYGSREELVLLGVMEIASGKELPLEDIGFPLVKRYEGLRDLQHLRSLESENKEGFVVRFSGGFRLKVKFDEYVRIHRIVTRVSSCDIWESLSRDESLDDLLERVPDEFYNWVKQTVQRLKSDFHAIETIARSEYRELETRKDTALYFQTCRYPGILFSMLKGEAYAPRIWKMIKPEYERPFQLKNDEF